MNIVTKSLLDQALALPASDRGDLAAALIESLGDEDAIAEEDIEAAWADEIRRRVADIDSGKTKMLSWEEVQRSMDDVRVDRHPV
jgi:putative addiction module component (TIGR02574 family)